jgi:hypothetical protein
VLTEFARASTEPLQICRTSPPPGCVSPWAQLSRSPGPALTLASTQGYAQQDTCGRPARRVGGIWARAAELLQWRSTRQYTNTRKCRSRSPGMAVEAMPACCAVCCVAVCGPVLPECRIHSAISGYQRQPTKYCVSVSNVQMEHRYLFQARRLRWSTVGCFKGILCWRSGGLVSSSRMVSISQLKMQQLR